MICTVLKRPLKHLSPNSHPSCRFVRMAAVPIRLATAYQPAVSVDANRDSAHNPHRGLYGDETLECDERTIFHPGYWVSVAILGIPGITFSPNSIG